MSYFQKVKKYRGKYNPLDTNDDDDDNNNNNNNNNNNIFFSKQMGATQNFQGFFVVNHSTFQHISSCKQYFAKPEYLIQFSDF